MRAERLTDSHLYHGEGPVWWPALGALRYVDMLAGDVMTWHPDGTITRSPVGSSVAAVLRPRRGGGAIVARERDVVLFDDDELTRPVWTSDPFVPEGQRSNEGGCDPQGRFYVGTMAYDKTEGVASMTRFTPSPEGGASARAEVVLTGLSVSNGLGWSPDGKVAYFADTPTGRVVRFDGGPGNGATSRPFAAVNGGEGRPDGLCLDAEGGVWVALNGDGRVHRYDPQGALTEVIDVGARQTTACTFGGSGHQTLFVTTSREGLEDHDDPAAGSLFAVEPGVAGLPPLPYDG